MKLTCVMIVAVLFLTALRLITSDNSRDKQEYHAVRSRDGIRNSKGSRSCSVDREGCATQACCPGLRCVGNPPGGMCVQDNLILAH
nr:conotoxin precursor O1 [Conus judaeus]